MQISASPNLFQQSLFSIPVKQVERIERNDPAIGMDDVDAGFLHAADIEIMGVEKLHDDDAENVVVGDMPRHSNLRQAAEQLLERRRLELGLAPVEKRPKSSSRSCGFCSYMMVLPSPCRRSWGSIMPVRGVTQPSSFRAYAIARQSG